MKDTSIDKWFPFLKEKCDSPFRLLCFSHAGGSASAYIKWIDFDPSVEVIPIELPGHGARIDEKSVIDFCEITEQIAMAIYSIWDQRPVFFFGHSMGSALAFEVAYKMYHTYNLKIKKLFVSARHAPHEEDLSEYRCFMGMQKLKEELIRAGNTPESILNNESYCRFFLPIIFRDYQLHESYNYHGQVIDIPIVSMSGMSDYGADAVKMRGWKQVTTTAFEQYSFPGDHFYLYNDSSDILLKTLLDEIKKHNIRL